MLGMRGPCSNASYFRITDWRMTLTKKDPKGVCKYDCHGHILLQVSLTPLNPLLFIETFHFLISSAARKRRAVDEMSFPQ